MVKVALLELKDPKNRNRWIIGTPTQVPKSSPFYSKQIQIAYVKNPEKGIIEKEPEHYHTPPIEEFYLILQGALKVKVEDNIIVLKSKQILAIPPNKRHKILDYSLPLQFFTIRAPISTEKTKIETS